MVLRDKTSGTPAFRKETERIMSESLENGVTYKTRFFRSLSFSTYTSQSLSLSLLSLNVLVRSLND